MTQNHSTHDQSETPGNGTTAGKSIAIMGAGIVGASAALALRRAGFDVILYSERTREELRDAVPATGTAILFGNSREHDARIEADRYGADAAFASSAAWTTRSSMRSPANATSGSSRPARAVWPRRPEVRGGRRGLLRARRRESRRRNCAVRPAQRARTRARAARRVRRRHVRPHLRGARGRGARRIRAGPRSNPRMTSHVRTPTTTPPLRANRQGTQR